jgi:hypothetical protein
LHSARVDRVLELVELERYARALTTEPKPRRPQDECDSVCVTVVVTPAERPPVSSYLLRVVLRAVAKRLAREFSRLSQAFASMWGERAPSSPTTASDEGGQIHDVLTVSQTNEPTIEEKWVIVRGASLLIATQYVTHLPPPEPGREIHHDHDPVQATISFSVAVMLAALGCWAKCQR